MKTFFQIKTLVRCTLAMLLAGTLFILGPGCDGNGTANAGVAEDTIDVEIVEKEMEHIKEVGAKLKKSEEDLRDALKDLENDSIKPE